MAYTQADLDAIDAAILGNQSKVRFADREVTYRTSEELLKTRDFVQTQLLAQAGTTRLYPRHQLADFSDE